jgi:hypothetical protein
LLEHVAVSWTVLFLATAEAEGVATNTIHDVRVLSVRDSLGRKLTFFAIGAPPDISVVVCERLTMPSHVLLEDLAVLLIL